MPNINPDDKLAIIGGSQGFRTISEIAKARAIDPIQTPFGLSTPIHRLDVDGQEVYFISRHGESGYHITAPYVNYRANIWALKEIGVGRIIAWSGPGAIDPEIPVGDILVPDDIIDETKGRPSTFYEGLGIGFIRQNPVFCPELSASLRVAIETRQGHCHSNDVYVCTQGPRLETRAEIRKFASYGGTLVGMTLVPEAFLARELEMCYSAVCYITNYAEGVVERSYRPGELFEGMLSPEERPKVDAAVEVLPGIAIEALVNAGKQCNCGLSMERYRRRGDIGNDWHTWISEGTSPPRT